MVVCSSASRGLLAARGLLFAAAVAGLCASGWGLSPARADGSLPSLWFAPLSRADLPSGGGDGNGDADPDRHFEASFGVDAGSHYWFLYSGATLAPFGDMHENGWRLRATGGYGSYDYVGPFKRRYTATTWFYEALVGYLHTFGPLTAKAFVGVVEIDHRTAEAKRPGVLSGAEFGFKGVLEFWLNIDRDWYASLDLAYATAHDTRSARARVGYRLDRNISLGLEARFNQDSQADYKMSSAERRDLQTDPLDYSWLGAFARYEWESGEISASAGLNAGSFSGSDGWFADDPSVYATINVLTRF